ncbi:hypothetical protein PybrP1_006205 [[Pythium] brassicae (nom. inval.)]|nr:hypothetical protein PybrP1_006205 [[Pythium] brassicae (nom. inval.)]
MAQFSVRTTASIQFMLCGLVMKLAEVIFANESNRSDPIDVEYRQRVPRLQSGKMDRTPAALVPLTVEILMSWSAISARHQRSSNVTNAADTPSLAHRIDREVVGTTDEGLPQGAAFQALQDHSSRPPLAR